MAETSKVIEIFEISDLLNPAMLANLLFDDLLAKKVIRDRTEQFAGTYFRFHQAQMNSLATEFSRTDPVTAAASQIGPRYFPDVFDGYRAENGITNDAAKQLVPQSVIDAQNWTEVSAKISPETRKDIRSRVDSLIETIRQSDLDERLVQNALKRAESVAELLDAPDPPWEVVVDLLNNRYLQAFLTALTIVQMIIG